MRRSLSAQVALAAVVLAGPTVLAFFSGGFFDEARAWAGAACSAALAVTYGLGFVRPGALDPSSRLGRPGRVALAGLAGLAAWTALSILWAPIAGSAYHYAQLAVLYLVAVLLAARVLGGRAAALVEPLLALGALAVIGYGLSERLLPGVLQFARSLSAQGRLEQPLTYWNATGELAAVGFVLATRLAGDVRRPRWLRLAGAAGGVPLALGVYLSFSRGALFAAAVGLVMLVLLARTVAQLRAALVAVAAALIASLVASLFGGVTGLHGTLATREAQGAAMTAALLAMAAAAAFALAVDARRGGGERALSLPPRAGRIALVLICAGLAVAIVAGAHEGSGKPLSAGQSRLETLQSNRYAYWGVALRAFAEDPLQGVGAGGWVVQWLEHRHIDEGAQDAHSLPLQTLAELGLVGALLLAAFLGGTGWAARRAWLADGAAAAGPLAAWLTWLVHQPLDWDWEMPALTLVACALAGMLIRAGGEA